MEKFGKQIDRNSVKKIIAKHDRTGDGMLNFYEYKVIFKYSNEINYDELLGAQTQN